MANCLYELESMCFSSTRFSSAGKMHLNQIVDYLQHMGCQCILHVGVDVRSRLCYDILLVHRLELTSLQSAGWISTFMYIDEKGKKKREVTYIFHRKEVLGGISSLIG